MFLMTLKGLAVSEKSSIFITISRSRSVESRSIAISGNKAASVVAGLVPATSRIAIP